jgi:hypothetical protein
VSGATVSDTTMLDFTGDVEIMVTIFPPAKSIFFTDLTITNTISDSLGDVTIGSSHSKLYNNVSISSVKNIQGYSIMNGPQGARECLAST